MAGIDLPEDVLSLMESAVPTIDALELLVFMAKNPEREWRDEDIVYEIRPVTITTAAVRENLALFQSYGLVAEKRSSRFQFEPATPRLQAAVDSLVQAYRERPVTLFRAISAAPKKESVQSFADAFRIKRR